MSSILTIQTTSPEETQRVGRLIGQQAGPGHVYLLTGPLGAGKTCLTQGIAWGLGVTAHPRSPTFVLITRYIGRLTLHHMDLYRINDPLEAWDLGLDEYLSGDGVCVIEWADQAEEVFSDEVLWINLDYTLSTKPIGGENESPQPPFAKGGPGGISEESIELSHQDASRVLTFGRHSPRYNSLLEKLAKTFPGVEETQ